MQQPHIATIDTAPAPANTTNITITIIWILQDAFHVKEQELGDRRVFPMATISRISTGVPVPGRIRLD